MVKTKKAAQDEQQNPETAEMSGLGTMEQDCDPNLPSFRVCYRVEKRKPRRARLTF